MTAKSEKVQQLLKTLPGADTSGSFDPRYTGWFHGFNRGEYYEAHDVLEDLWLEEGHSSTDYAFYKGLIQLAGAFVHMKLHATHPDHPVHGKRLGPAARLLRLAQNNLTRYPRQHMGMDLSQPLGLITHTLDRLQTQPDINPWHPSQKPRLDLP